MPFRFYAVLVVLVFTTVLAFPLFQAYETGGVVFYLNAFDEGTYLAYPYSRLVQSPTRAVQYLVTGLHAAGLSGGWQNAIFDTVCLACLLWAARGIFRRLGYSPESANAGSLCVLLFPLVFNGANPLVSQLFQWNFAAPSFSWVTIPEGTFLPFVRTPEPQFSLTLIGLAGWLALRRRSFLPAAAVVPVLYPFVQVPYAIFLVGLFLSTRSRLRTLPAWAAGLAAFGVVSLGCLVVSAVLGDWYKAALVQTRLPLVTFSGTACALMLLVIYQLPVSPQLRRAAVLATASVWGGANTQVVSGWLAVPSNYEQSWGVVCAGTLATLVLVPRSGRGLTRAVTGLATSVLAAMLVGSAHWYTNTNLRCHRYVLADPRTLTALHDEPALVAFDDLSVAGVAVLAYPRQDFTALAFARSYQVLARSSFDEYLCARRELLADPATAPRYGPTIATLDTAFRHGSTDFPLLHIRRKSEFPVLFDVTRPGAPDCPPRKRLIIPGPPSSSGL